TCIMARAKHLELARKSDQGPDFIVRQILIIFSKLHRHAQVEMNQLADPECPRDSKPGADWRDVLRLSLFNPFFGAVHAAGGLNWERQFQSLLNSPGVELVFHDRGKSTLDRLGSDPQSRTL